MMDVSSQPAVEAPTMLPPKLSVVLYMLDPKLTYGVQVNYWGSLPFEDDDITILLQRILGATYFVLETSIASHL